MRLQRHEKRLRRLDRLGTFFEMPLTILALIADLLSLFV